MCGRFTLTVPLEAIMSYYSVTELPFTYQPRFNIAPGQMITAVLKHQEKHRIGQLKWGLIPSWAKPEQKLQFINAKSETLWDKPSFRKLISRKRCIVPADSFYEWKLQHDQKQPMRILLSSRQMFSMAALYDSWIAPDGNTIHTCSIITTRPNELVKDIHNRMPVILAPEQEAIWLDRDIKSREALEPLLEPYPAERMTSYPVSPIVGNVRNDHEECITPIETI